MLSISSKQMTTLQERQRERFMSDCKASLREAHDLARTLADDELDTRIQALLANFSEFGIGGSGHLLRALHLAFALPDAVRSRPMPADLLAQLRSACVPVERKLEALEQLTLFPAG